MVTDRGLETFGVMLMGYFNGPQHMQRGMAKWIRFLDKWASVFIDDVTLMGDSCRDLVSASDTSGKSIWRVIAEFHTELDALLKQDPETWSAVTDHVLQLDIFFHRTD